MNLEGVAVIITGGGSGLGAATARAMAAKGAKVTVIDVNRDNAEGVASELHGIGAVADVSVEDQVNSALDKGETAHGVARVLVNCAGIGGGGKRTLGKAGPYPLDQFARVINVNLIGTFNVIRLAAERLAGLPPLGEERGVFINTASVAAFDGQIGQAGYAASKAGIAGLTLPVARDLSQIKIRVNTIAPGLFLTPMLMGLSEQVRASLAEQVPHPARLGSPNEYAALAVHIVENAMLNGETIRLDGAIRMAPK
ncbi:SDR family NAD(P)-dependent oxidoreductase [Bradyrhizobium sp. KB893862 SZCCT0404]|uniref:SDR family NAD(P)-dependent oxidoreductase n=1 Tax=Bradyrhizobium sp. KB893862 SZCCT0404 TaxID=2807672 RepID=UPI001BA8044D|nr:SDR family NAD(P)-dependent oxidoreductase [Bradyrhizobium sp. KB893862 SZCCT0404]MBR1176993.1 SDR family NAD(P)-dependent oxidoreductase [Bradyrhizobium sp. KB893862 SZCCT0404]